MDLVIFVSSIIIAAILLMIRVELKDITESLYKREFDNRYMNFILHKILFS